MCVTVLVMTFRAIELPVDNYKGFRRRQATNMTVWWRKRDTNGLFVRRGEAKIIGMEKWRGQESRVTDEEAIVWERSSYCHCTETCRCVCSKHEVQPPHYKQSGGGDGPWPEAWCFCPFVPSLSSEMPSGNFFEICHRLSFGLKDELIDSSHTYHDRISTLMSNKIEMMKRWH